MHLRTALIFATMWIVSACATGPRYPEAASTIPELKLNEGRIYFYRPSSFGAAVQPSIYLNGTKVGTAKPYGFYFVDRAPGDYEVSAETETVKKLTFTLEAGQQRYVRLKSQMGALVLRVVPELVDKAQAMQELGKLHFIAEPLR